jgi:hypothetical protein
LYYHLFISSSVTARLQISYVLARYAHNLFPRNSNFPLNRILRLVAYVDNQLLSLNRASGEPEPKLVEAAILSLNDAGVWAISKGYDGKVRL